jgi:hypothetical protein
MAQEAYSLPLPVHHLFHGAGTEKSRTLGLPHQGSQ